jgi:hypothetical protein
VNAGLLHLQGPDAGDDPVGNFGLNGVGQHFVSSTADHFVQYIFAIGDW